jgi:ABC-type multidrug transport system fused ATPase/permease subunit
VALIAVTAQQRNVEIATVGLVAVLLYRSFSYGETLVGVHQKLVQLIPVLDQLEEGVDKLRRGARRPGSLEVGRLQHIQVDQLTFRYPGSDLTALESVSFGLDAGDVVGVVGPSGAGKSTLAELLLGLRQPAAGSIRLNGIDLQDLTLASRSSVVTLVSQAVPLVPGSIRDNVRFFRTIDDQAVDAAIAAAGLTSVVSTLPHGADTLIGPGARSVSGGQAQRIGIARALAANPSLLVLDEPTSALDADAEQIVTDLIGELRGAVGVLVIAHRLTTLRHCDRVLVIEDGCKTDEGPLDEVRNRNEFLRHAFKVGALTTD